MFGDTLMTQPCLSLNIYILMRRPKASKKRINF